eukprot:GSMAST32.ASY1.ANO1.749.1 assembled CDS
MGHLANTDKNTQKNAKRSAKKTKSSRNKADFKIERHVVASKMSTSAKLQRILTDAPELLTLLDDFKSKSEQLKGTVEPLIQKVKEGGLATEKGLSYLDVKFHLILSYCINVGFYMLLKSKGISVKDHPVIDQLIHLRVLMDKLKPVDKKLKYQIDKLLKVDLTSVESEKTSGKADADALHFAPNLDDLAGGDSDEANDTVPGIYQAPRMMAVPYDEEGGKQSSAAKAERKEAKRRERLKKSKILRELREEMSARPQELREEMTGDQEADEEAAERRRYEEENFTRLTLTKKQKNHAAAARTGRLPNAFQELTDFGDRRVSLQSHVNRIEQRQKQKKNGSQSADAVFMKDPDVVENQRRLQNQRLAATNDSDSDDYFSGSRSISSSTQKNIDSDVGEDAFYSATKARQQKKKRKRAEAYAVAPMLTGADEVVDDNEARKASRTILKNRGLTAHRKKQKRNPRVDKRIRYAKRVKARGGQIRKVRTGETQKYQGEVSGIRSDIARSRKIK